MSIVTTCTMHEHTNDLFLVQAIDAKRRTTLRLQYDEIFLLCSAHGAENTLQIAQCGLVRGHLYQEHGDHSGDWSRAKDLLNEIFDGHLFEAIHVSVGVLSHLLLLSVRLENVWQIQNGPRVTAIHEAGHGRVLWHATDKFRKDGIVTDLTSRLVIYRNECFVVAIVFVIVVIGETTAVSGIMKESAVSSFCFRHERSKGRNDVIMRWILVLVVVLVYDRRQYQYHSDLVPRTMSI